MAMHKGFRRFAAEESNALDPLRLGQNVDFFDQPAIWHVEADLNREVLGSSIAGFTVERLLSVGGLSLVYLAACSTPSQRQVVVKIPRFGPFLDRTSRMLVHETEVLRSLKDIPGVVSILGSGSAKNGLPYLMLEYIPGRPLGRFLDHALSTKIRLLVKVCVIVDRLHQRGIVHGDLKPSNIIVSPNLSISLIDFGSSGRVSEKSHSLPAITPRYSPPERIRTGRLTPGADLFAIGVTAFDLLENHRGTSDRPSRSLLKVLARSTNDCPSKRFSSISDLACSLQALVR